MSINPVNAAELMAKISDALRDRLITENRDKVIDIRSRYHENQNRK
jgi:hypothetical protein